MRMTVCIVVYFSFIVSLQHLKESVGFEFV